MEMTKRMDTKIAIEKYMETLSETKRAENGKMLDVDVVLAYENRIGKSVFDMSMEEIYGLVKDCSLNVSAIPSSSVVFKFVKFFSALTEWYSDNVEQLLSPVRKARVTNTECFEKVIEDEPVLNKEYLESVIAAFKDDKDLWEGKRIYMEMILRLFYAGFYSTEEIILLQEKDINFGKMTIKLPGRDIKLDKRTFDLLLYCHSVNEFYTSVEHREGVRYKNSFINFFTKDENIFNMQESNKISLFKNNLNSVVFKTLREKYNIFIRGRQIHIMGIYEKIKDTFGDRTDQILRSNERQDNAKVRAALEAIGTPIPFANFKHDVIRCMDKRK